MENNNSYKPVVLVVADGFGLSTSWQGNAVSAGTSEYFDGLWKEYRHMIIRQRLLDPQNPHLNYRLLSEGASCLVNDDNAFCIVDSDTWAQKTFGDMARNNSVAHLFVDLSVVNDDQSKVLLAFLADLRDRHVSTAFIHLFVDNSFSSQSELEQVLDKLELDLSTVGLGNIATISGQKFIKPTNTDRIFDALYFGQGPVYLSPKQAIAKNKDKGFASIPTSLIKSSYNISIKDFDSVIILKAVNEDFLGLFKQMINKNTASGGKFPKFLNFISYREFPFDFADKIHFMKKSQAVNLLEQVSDEHKFKKILISDSGNFKALKLYLLGNVDQEKIIDINDPSNLVSTTLEIAEATLAALKEKEFDFLIVNLPSLYRQTTQGAFSECVAEMKRIDDFLSKVVPHVLESDGFVVFCSAFSGAEELVENRSLMRDNKSAPTKDQSLPFLLVSNHTKHQSRGEILPEMIKSHLGLEIINEAICQFLLKKEITT